MQSRPFDPTRQVPILGQGTWNIETADRASVIAALRRGLDLGMTHIDTAEMYGDGAAEEIVGEAIAGRRDEVFLVSKVLPQNASKSGTVAACEKSLARLRTDRLDCYLLHWRGRHPLADTFAAFEQLQKQGKILSWGVSNFDEEDLEEAHGLVGDGRISEKGTGPLKSQVPSPFPSMACNQVLYHLKERAIEHAVIPWCEKHGVAVVAYSPFGSGDFPKANTEGGRALAEIAKAHGATARQVALAFLLRIPSLFAIPKSSTPEHVAENAATGELQLTEAEIDRIDKAFPRGPKPRELPTL